MFVKWKFTRLSVLLPILCLLFPPSCFAVEKGLAKQVLDEINIARKNPHAYAGFLREFRGQFRGDSYRLPGREAMVRTSEGVKGIDEAIRYLARQKPLPPMVWSAGLAAAAAELAVEEGASGAVGHRGRSCGGPAERIERHRERPRALGENIFYGPGDARQVVMNLIIDDGVPDRGHRKNIFLPAFAAAGVACGPHPGYEALCVIDFASE